MNQLKVTATSKLTQLVRMKKKKKIKVQTIVYVAWFGEVKKNIVIYSFFDRATGERTYITEGVCFIQSDIGKIVFLSEEEAKNAVKEHRKMSICKNKKVQYVGSKKIRTVRKKIK